MNVSPLFELHFGLLREASGSLAAPPIFTSHLLAMLGALQVEFGGFMRAFLLNTAVAGCVLHL